MIDVALHQESQIQQFCVINIKNIVIDSTLHWKIHNGAGAFSPGYLDRIIVIEDDRGPKDPDSFIRVLCWRGQSDRDIKITPGKTNHLEPFALAHCEIYRFSEYPPATSILINASKKYECPPTPLPKKKYMMYFRELWEERLPLLPPKISWYDYSLEYWPNKYEKEVKLARKGVYLKLVKIC